MTIARLVCWVLLCCVPLQARTQQPVQLVTHVRLAAERLEYRGLITREANAGLFDLYESAHAKPRSLLIESHGGSADAGMQLGTWVFEHALAVEIDTFCFSSCANYVFPAGRVRVLAAHASLMWHGGVTQPVSRQELEGVLDATLADIGEQERRELLARHSRAELVGQLQGSVAELVARESRFFAQIGVDQRITTLGHLYERELLQGQGHYPGWDFSLEDMARLGIGAVRIKDGATWEPVCPIAGQQVYRIRLDELPNFEPRLPST